MAVRIFSVTGVSVSGSRRASSRVEAERWVSGSKRRMDSISSPKKSMRTGRSDLGRVDVEDAAAEGDLAGHLDHIDAGVADGEEMLDEHVGEVLFAALEVEGEGGVVLAREEAHAGGFDGRDDEAGRAAGDLPERGGAGLLNLGVGREIFKREDIVCGEAQDGFGVERAGELAGGEDGGVEGFGGFVVGDEDEAGCVCGSRRRAEDRGRVR